MSVSARAALSYSSLLRYELSVRNQEFARRNQIPFSLSYGDQPTVVFSPYAEGSLHGNFLPATWRAILANPAWCKRLSKPHTQARKSLPRYEYSSWKELDSSASSDALLMNVFCHPQAFADGRLHSLLGTDEGSTLDFGHKARVPLRETKVDRTEVDLRIGNLFFEAKLTEGDFQCKSRAYLERYGEFCEIFDRKLLPHNGEIYPGYQLIRNVLAAHATGGSFCVIADERRPDLKEAWYSVLRAVKPVLLRLRSKMLTWQELTQALPDDLQQFLADKYGIYS